MSERDTLTRALELGEEILSNAQAGDHFVVAKYTPATGRVEMAMNSGQREAIVLMATMYQTVGLTLPQVISALASNPVKMTETIKHDIP